MVPLLHRLKRLAGSDGTLDLLLILSAGLLLALLLYAAAGIAASDSWPMWEPVLLFGLTVLAWPACVLGYVLLARR